MPATMHNRLPFITTHIERAQNHVIYAYKFRDKIAAFAKSDFHLCKYGNRSSQSAFFSVLSLLLLLLPPLFKSYLQSYYGLISADCSGTIQTVVSAENALAAYYTVRLEWWTSVCQNKFDESMSWNALLPHPHHIYRAHSPSLILCALQTALHLR